MMMLVRIFLALTIVAYQGVSMETEVVATGKGKVQGVVETSSIDRKSVQKFLNIPYAEAPVGKLRFSKPVPKKPWNETLNNNNVSIACWQYLKHPKPNIILKEDCLILNIWRPYPVKTNLSVMVWIHGDGFRWGYSNMYHVHNFVAMGDVILVTINYRLSVLGFLASGDKRIKGNFGLFDQRLAMRWVKENIANFGGDPQSITIFGSSAGAVSVSAHTLSKKSWPYFNRVILQSGGMNMNFATAPKHIARLEFKKFLEEVSCRDDKNVSECLRSNFTENNLKRIFQNNSKSFDGLWLAPYVHDGDFFTDEPEELLFDGKIKPTDILMGVMKDEAFREVVHYLKESKSINFLKNLFDEDVDDYFDDDISDETFEKIVELYEADEDFKSPFEAIKPVIDFRTDSLFICPATQEATIRAQLLSSNNIYFYRDSYASSLPMPDFYSNGTFGFAAHGLDIYSMFGYAINNSVYPAEDQILSMRMILYWTNFAKNSDPNMGITELPIVINYVTGLPKWRKYENKSREYLDMVNSTYMIIGARLRETECEFLESPEETTTPATSQPTQRETSQPTKRQTSQPTKRQTSQPTKRQTTKKSTLESTSVASKYVLVLHSMLVLPFFVFFTF